MVPQIEKTVIEQLERLVDEVSTQPGKPKMLAIEGRLKSKYTGEVFYDRIPRDTLLYALRVGNALVFVIDHIDDHVIAVFQAQSIEEGIQKLAAICEERDDVEVLSVEEVREW